MILRTARLRFDEWEEADLPLLHALHADPTVQTGYAAGPEAWTWAGIAERLRGYRSEQDTYGHTKWKLSLLDGSFVGRAGWSPWDDDLEIGYAIQPVHQQRGYAREAAAALVGWALHHRAGKGLVGFALTGNEASRRVLQSIGMRFVDERLIAGAANAFYRYDVAAEPPFSVTAR